MGLTVFLQGQDNKRVVVDFVAVAWWFIGFFWFAQLQTWVDLDLNLAVKGIIGAIFLIGGALFSFIIVGVNWDKFFSLSELINQGLLGAVVVNLIVVGSGVFDSPVPINSATFAVLMGTVGEETLLRGALLTTLSKMYGDLVGIFGSTIVGTLIHSVIYGDASASMLSVFGSFLFFGIGYVYSRYRLSVPMTCHAIFNLLASMG